MASAEELVLVLRGIGSTMVVTTDRLIVARDGLDRRPRTGLQSFRLEAISHVRIEAGVPQSGRIAVLVSGHEAVSMFFDPRSRDRALEAVSTTRRLIARRRREHEETAPRESG
jgi:hypothetical protein